MSLIKKLTVSNQEGRFVAEEDFVIFILYGLGSKFKELSTAIRARESDISFEELHDKLTGYEAIIKQDLVSISIVIAQNVQINRRGRGSYSNREGQSEEITITEITLPIRRRNLFHLHLQQFFLPQNQYVNFMKFQVISLKLAEFTSQLQKFQ